MFTTVPAFGRPANLVRVDGGRALFIGVKVTGDEVIGVLTDLCCRIRVARRLPLPDREPRTVLAHIAELVRLLLARRTTPRPRSRASASRSPAT